MFETFEKCSISKSPLIWSRSRKARISTTGIYRIFRVPPKSGMKFEHDTEIGRISADFERGLFSKVSKLVPLYFPYYT